MMIMRAKKVPTITRILQISALDLPVGKDERDLAAKMGNARRVVVPDRGNEVELAARIAHQFDRLILQRVPQWREPSK